MAVGLEISARVGPPAGSVRPPSKSRMKGVVFEVLALCLGPAKIISVFVLEKPLGQW
jgi:hypothetical protein